jgi:hypothetical protein
MLSLLVSLGYEDIQELEGHIVRIGNAMTYAPRYAHRNARPQSMRLLGKAQVPFSLQDVIELLFLFMNVRGDRRATPNIHETNLQFIPSYDVLIVGVFLGMGGQRVDINDNHLRLL